jgi:uncharacterized membrane protein
MTNWQLLFVLMLGFLAITLWVGVVLIVAVGFEWIT